MKKYYPFLDGFRAIAILMIMAHHARRAFDLNNLLANDPIILGWIYFKANYALGLDLTDLYYGLQHFIYMIKGILGIEMFLVISGFLITDILFGDGTRPPSVGRFYQRRLFRIYPSYVLLVIISLTAFYFRHPEPWTNISAVAAHYLLLIQNYFPRNPFLEHAWTLVVLEQFYFFCPLVVMCVYARASSPEQRRKALVVICLLVMAAVTFLRWYFLTYGHALITWPLKSPYPFKTTLNHADAIAFGCLLALLKPYWSSVKQAKVLGIALWSSGMGLFYYLYYIVDWSYYWGEWYLYTLGYLAIGALVVAAFYGVSVFTRLKLLQWIGRHAYGIFVWNYLVLISCKAVIGKEYPTLQVLFYFILSVALGVLSTKTLERYFLRIREKVSPKT